VFDEKQWSRLRTWVNVPLLINEASILLVLKIFHDVKVKNWKRIEWRPGKYMDSLWE